MAIWKWRSAGAPLRADRFEALALPPDVGRPPAGEARPVQLRRAFRSSDPCRISRASSGVDSGLLSDNLVDEWEVNHGHCDALDPAGQAG